MDAELEQPIATLLAIATRIERGPPRRTSEPVIANLRASLRALFDAADQREDPARALERALGAALQAAAVVDATSSPEVRAEGASTAAEIVRAARAIAAHTQVASTVEATRLAVWNGAPPAHRVRRPSLVPRFRPAKPPPAPAPTEPADPSIDGARVRTFADLDRAAKAFEAISRETLAAALARGAPRKADRELDPPTAAAAKPPAPLELPSPAPKPIGRDAFAAQRARELFEEMRMAMIHRAPHDGEPFTVAHEIERRMMESVEAFCALGAPAFAALEALACDAPAPDPTRVFAAALLASCVRGRDLFAVTERSLGRTGRGDRAMLAGLVEGIVVGASPDADPALVAWTRERGPRVREAAAAALARRGALPKDVALALARDADVDVAAIGAAELARLRAAEAPLVLESLAERGRADLPATFGPIARALAIGRSPALATLAAEATGAHAEAPLALAIARGRGAFEPLLRAARTAPSGPLLLALGFTGDVRALPVLAGALAHDDEAVADAAARALARITGGFPLVEAAVDPERRDELVLPDPTSTGPLDKPRSAIGSKDRVRLLSRDPAAWSPFIAAVSARKEDLLRHGEGWRREAALDELRAVHPFPSSPLERTWVHLELAFREGARGRFHAGDLVVTQLACADRLFA